MAEAEPEERVFEASLGNLTRHCPPLFRGRDVVPTVLAHVEARDDGRISSSIVVHLVF